MTSAFDSIAKQAIATVFDTFAEGIEIVTAGGTTSATGIYSQQPDSGEFGGASVDSLDPTIELLQADVTATGISDGDVIRARGKDLTVVSLLPQDDGTWLATVREYE